MKSEQILARLPRVLSREQREFYFENGYLLLEGFVSREWLDRIREVSNAFIERSRELTESNTMLALDPAHTAENPRLRRLIGPTAHHCRTIHGSLPNMSDRGRPLLLHTYAAADALPLTPRPTHTTHEGRMVRGEPARWVEFDSDSCQLPPDRAGESGITIFSSQNRERSA